MKLKVAGIALKRPRNGTETKATHKRVEESRSYSSSLPYREQLQTNVTCPKNFYSYAVT